MLELHRDARAPPGPRRAAPHPRALAPPPRAPQRQPGDCGTRLSFSAAAARPGHARTPARAHQVLHELLVTPGAGAPPRAHLRLHEGLHHALELHRGRQAPPHAPGRERAPTWSSTSSTAAAAEDERR
ncbi:hypothetical protein OWM54_42960 [Myxococcus sp. MISCRS1]|uniref:hypothetical protein n=1 Tax=Myxococcus sp. MISCRS1 TaxID=2996786 RepID=UPI00226ED219|nr:hypothetical protein [Myxococcus sp. MISCRS1]MCY1003926.1 hypothetical protein [Myxococcus sp. MISCRS1]